MKKNAVCTIVTSNYQHYALGLFDSIIESDFVDFQFFIFVACSRVECNKLVEHPQITYVFVEDVCTDDLGSRVFNAYFSNEIDKFRWSMKPVLINYILGLGQFEKVMCVDCDINFYSSPQFLFQLLDEHSVLLTPHHRASMIKQDKENFLLLFTQGIYNAGFVAANKDGMKAMSWWAENCIEICTKDSSIGQYDDQTHLNLMPVYFEGVHIVKHRGCNLAVWNLVECKRQCNEHSQVKINDTYDVVFVHYTANTVRNIRFGSDRLLDPHLVKYIERLQKHKPDFVHPAIQEYLNRKKIVKRKPTISQRMVNRLKRLFEK